MRLRLIDFYEQRLIEVRGDVPAGVTVDVPRRSPGRVGNRPAPVLMRSSTSSRPTTRDGTSASAQSRTSRAEADEPLRSVREGAARPSERAALGRILLVDDEAPVIEVLRDYLLEAGYHVEVALTGGDALMLIQQDRPDVVLLDLYMPGMDGVEVLRRILAFDATIPVIIATANLDLSLAQKTLKLGASDYVTKPFDFEYLNRAVAACLGRAAEDLGGLPADPGAVYADLTSAVMRAVRDLGEAARLSLRERVERTVLQAGREARAARKDQAAELLRQLEILVQAAIDLGDMPLAHRRALDAALLKAHNVLSRLAE